MALDQLGPLRAYSQIHQRVIQGARELAEELTQPRMQIEALTGLADATRRLGDLDRARTCAELAVHRAARSGYRMLESAARRVLDEAGQLSIGRRPRLDTNG
jgi:hypothetical protein